MARRRGWLERKFEKNVAASKMKTLRYNGGGEGGGRGRSDARTQECDHGRVQVSLIRKKKKIVEKKTL